MCHKKVRAADYARKKHGMVAALSVSRIRLRTAGQSSQRRMSAAAARGARDRSSRASRCIFWQVRGLGQRNILQAWPKKILPTHLLTSER